REHAPLAVDVAQRAADQDQRAQRQEIGVRHPLLSRQAAAEVALDRRQRHVHDRPVDRGDAGTENRGEEREPLGPGHPSPASPRRSTHVIPRIVTRTISTAVQERQRATVPGARRQTWNSATWLLAPQLAQTPVAAVSSA